MTNQNWEAVLESEGLGLLDVDHTGKHSNLGNIKGKWRRLEADLNAIEVERELMSDSFVTARGSETRYTFASDVNHIASHDSKCTVLDSLAYAMSATEKEAELADRARQSVLGLDKDGVVRRGVSRVKLSSAQKAENIRAVRSGVEMPHQTNPFIEPEAVPVAYAIPKYDYFKKEQGLPCAKTDAGNGPLSIKGEVKADVPQGSVSDDHVRLSPIVDTEGYLPGRSPFQMGRLAARNSDITG
jgi:hypothetical protein